MGESAETIEQATAMIGRRLQQAREEQQQSVEAVARKAGMTPAAIEEMERGQIDLRSEEILAAISAINVSFDRVLAA